MSIESKLTALVQLAHVDGDFSEEEKELIYTLGKAHSISAEEIDGYLDHPQPMPDIALMSEEDKVDHLFHLVQLMKIDSQVYLSEIKFCEAQAEKLGFKPSVISELSARIHSDPALSSDVSALKRITSRHQR